MSTQTDFFFFLSCTNLLLVLLLFCLYLLLLWRLQAVADQLVEHFVSAGLMVREWDRVKLHGTVMNTLFRKDSTGKAITRGSDELSTSAAAVGSKTK